MDIFEQVDEQSVEEQLFNFVEDLQYALGREIESDVSCRDILLCGLGGSGFSGMFVRDCCMVGSRIPIRTNGNPYLPSWASKDTLLVVSSYSGNTVETVQMFDDGIRRGCKIIVMTSGGELEKRASEHGVEVIRIRRNMQPRHAIGYMIGHTLAIVRKAGAVNLVDTVLGCMESLKIYRDFLDGPGYGNEVSELAEEFRDTVPVMCGDSSLESICFRWKTQINENSKKVAFNNVDDDSIFVRMDAWQDSSRRECVPVTLNGFDDGNVEPCFKDNIRDVCSERQLLYREVSECCDSVIEGMLRLLMFGDYVSLRLARLRDMEPTLVTAITDLKKLMRDMPFRPSGF